MESFNACSKLHARVSRHNANVYASRPQTSRRFEVIGIVASLSTRWSPHATHNPISDASAVRTEELILSSADSLVETCGAISNSARIAGVAKALQFIEQRQADPQSHARCAGFF